MDYQDLKTGDILPAKKYNDLAVAKWHKDWDKAKAEGRHWGQMPQLAFYGFYRPNSGEHRTTGYVKKMPNGSHWFKTKREAMVYDDKKW